VTMPMRANRATLTKRQLDIVEMMAEGMYNPEIAERLHISVNTVKSHGAAIRARLNTHGRVETVAEAVRRGLLV